MDFTLADDFLEHLELHPNGSFVLVKKDLPSQLSLPISPHQQQQQQPPPAPPSPKIIINHDRRPINNNKKDDDDEDENRKLGSNNVARSNGLCELTSIAARNNNNNVQSESEEEAPIIPEMLKNQIKIEPISEDEEEQQEANHISNTSFSHNQGAHP